MIRYWGFGVLLLATACQQQPKPLNKPTEIAFDGAQVTNAAAKITHGERISWTLGCRGCHGPDLSGRNFTADEPRYGPLYASNLTLVVPRFSNSQVETILRTGMHPERGRVWVMPSEMFHPLAPDDLAALLAYLRSLPPSGQPTPPPQFSAQDRKDIASGEYRPATVMVAEAIKHPAADLGANYALGRYVASVSCTECHGSALAGKPGYTPNLIVAGGYSRAEFERLITLGIPTGNRKLKPLMVDAAQTRFSHLTPHERDALYAYLKARAEKAQ